MRARLRTSGRGMGGGAAGPAVPVPVAILDGGPALGPEDLLLC